MCTFALSISPPSLLVCVFCLSEHLRSSVTCSPSATNPFMVSKEKLSPIESGMEAMTALASRRATSNWLSVVCVCVCVCVNCQPFHNHRKEISIQSLFPPPLSIYYSHSIRSSNWSYRVVSCSLSSWRRSFVCVWLLPEHSAMPSGHQLSAVWGGSAGSLSAAVLLCEISDHHHLTRDQVLSEHHHHTVLSPHSFYSHTRVSKWHRFAWFN